MIPHHYTPAIPLQKKPLWSSWVQNFLSTPWPLSYMCRRMAHRDTLQEILWFTEEKGLKRCLLLWEMLAQRKKMGFRVRAFIIICMGKNTHYSKQHRISSFLNSRAITSSACVQYCGAKQQNSENPHFWGYRHTLYFVCYARTPLKFLGFIYTRNVQHCRAS